MSSDYAKAHDLLRRWLRYDVGETDDPTLEAETTAWMTAHSLPVIADDSAVLAACASLVIHEHGYDDDDISIICSAGQNDVTAAEWTRRENRARAAEFQRGIDAVAPELGRAIAAGWRRLESNR